MGTRRPAPVPLLLALFALAMLSFASVRSVLMQAMPPVAEAAAPGTVSGMSADMPDMPGMAVARSAGRLDGHPAGKVACPYCDVAAHLPIVGHAEPPRRGAPVAFAAFRAAEQSGPRGPPFLAVRARGPPA